MLSVRKVYDSADWFWPVIAFSLIWISYGNVTVMSYYTDSSFDQLRVNLFSNRSDREAQDFIEKFEGALGKGKGKKLYAYKVMMTKVTITILLTL